MSDVSLPQHAWPDGDTVVVQGPGLRAVVLPRRGGKIVSLRDDDGREWLAQPESPVGPPARPGDGFLAAEMAGWDECAPTIVACEVDDLTLPDHGSLWTAKGRAVGRTVTLVDDTLGFRFERSIEPSGRGLRFDYRVTTPTRTIPFLWAAHPQFAAPPGTIVRVPAHVTTAVDVLDPALPERPWDGATASIDDLDEGECRKVYVHPETPVFAASLSRRDATLSMRWSAACPYLGVWMERGLYRSGPVVAIEPSTSYFDALDVALAAGRTPTVSPEKPLAWTIWLEPDADRA
ncbi:hypothetical protein [Microbacterium sp. BK668]|uniref:hypothetical protein n=1 Tax=Microbacterium sp. BK668 TaxID=2512118 RepID=UPI0010D24367|nr:hypothetical protein [Microbacterium sp. BK668]TDN91577.1 hypothetical protein EV279_1079 [Microbacterium sp. BK668]